MFCVRGVFLDGIVEASSLPYIQSLSVQPHNKRGASLVFSPRAFRENKASGRALSM